MKCKYPGVCRHQGKNLCTYPNSCIWQEGEDRKNKSEIHEDICQQLTETYRRKNADYGDSFSKIRNELGETVILVRLADKLERLKSLLTGSKQQVNDESIDDTLLDLANYAILELIERKLEKEGK